MFVSGGTFLSPIMIVYFGDLCGRDVGGGSYPESNGNTLILLTFN